MVNHLRLLAPSIVFLLCLPSATAAQSTELDQPTRLTAKEMSGIVDHEVTNYYSFDAEPGEVTIFLSVTHARNTFEVLDPNLRDIAQEHLFTEGEDQKVMRLNITRKATLILKVTSRPYDKVAGKYRFRLGGTVVLGSGDTWPPGLPHEGVITFKMKDGTSKVVDLKEVSGVNIR